MQHSLKLLLGSSLVTAGAVITYLWLKKKSYEKVGTVKKLYFFPVKSLKAIEVQEGTCTELGFQVDGVLDRTFMVVNAEGMLVSQREAPTLALLTQSVLGKTVIITTPSGDQLKLEIKDSANLNDKMIACRIHGDTASGYDCGSEAAKFFQTFLNMPDVCLVRFMSSLPHRKYTRNNLFYANLRNNNKISFQDLSSIHILSQESINDLNSKIGSGKVSHMNFRPNILVEGCAPYAEDSWKLITIGDVVLKTLVLVTRCILTTNNPETAVLSKKEPLVTLRKYRIPKDPEMFQITGSVPCLGTACAVAKTGKVKVGDDIFAQVGRQYAMKEYF